MGRRLATMSKTGTSISYKYNDNGIRTQKTVNGVTTNYHLVGDNVTFETNGTDNIYYYYDANGKLLSMSLNGAMYYYLFNGQGDIIDLLDENLSSVAKYTYDSWGKLVSITGTLANTVGVKNPYRYRGYRYDTETGLYYLQSRYYNPEWGRWLNADSNLGQPSLLLSHNLFTYCYNNPVNMIDVDGECPILIGAGFGLLIGFGASIISQAVSGNGIDWRKVGIDTLAGGASGALAGSGVGLVVAIVGNAAISAGASIAKDSIDKKKLNEVVLNAIKNGTIGGAAGWFGGPGALNAVKNSSALDISGWGISATVKVITPSKKITDTIVQIELVKAGVKATITTTLDKIFNN